MIKEVSTTVGLLINAHSLTDAYQVRQVFIEHNLFMLADVFDDAVYQRYFGDSQYCPEFSGGENYCPLDGWNRLVMDTLAELQAAKANIDSVQGLEIINRNVSEAIEYLSDGSHPLSARDNFTPEDFLPLNDAFKKAGISKFSISTEQQYLASNQIKGVYEMLFDGRGDCDDYANLTYHLFATLNVFRGADNLRQSGKPLPEEDFYMATMEGKESAHAVFTVKIDGEFMVLDYGVSTLSDFMANNPYKLDRIRAFYKNNSEDVLVPAPTYP